MFTLLGCMLLGSTLAQFCPSIFAPVCGIRLLDRSLRTFPNECVLDNQEFSNIGGRYRLLHQGECNEDSSEEGSGICTTIYQPVCGIRWYDRRQQTFSNECVLRHQRAGFRFLHEGECRQIWRPLPIEPYQSQSSYLIQGPGEISGASFGERDSYNHEEASSSTYGNSHSESNSYQHSEENEESSYGGIGSRYTRVCPEIYQPVCGVIGYNQNRRTFPNECILIHEGYQLLHQGPCLEGPQACTLQYAPVCAISYTQRHERTFSNECFLRIEQSTNPFPRYQFLHEGECQNGLEQNNYNQGESYSSSNSESSSYSHSETNEPALYGGIRSRYIGGPEACTREFAPVCAISYTQRHERTFSNECLLRVEQSTNPFARYEFLHQGECRNGLGLNNYGEEESSSSSHSETSSYSHSESNEPFYGGIQSRYIGGPQGCTLQYEPVCAISLTQRHERTFSNECLLRVEQSTNPFPGYRFLHEGECRNSLGQNNYGEEESSSSSHSESYSHSESNEPLYGGIQSRYIGEPQGCTYQYEPVCAISLTQRHERTFSNECLLRVEQSTNPFPRYRFLHEGECQHGLIQNNYGEEDSSSSSYSESSSYSHSESNEPSYYGGIQSRFIGVCPLNFQPVCGINRFTQNRETFSNECEMRRAGYQLLHQGQCADGSQACTLQYEPVCAISLTQRHERTFSNECLLRNEQSTNPFPGYRFLHVGECGHGQTQVCSLIYRPVCGIHRADGSQRTFSNECLLRNERGLYQLLHEGQCHQGSFYQPQIQPARYEQGHDEHDEESSSSSSSASSSSGLGGASSSSSSSNSRSNSGHSESSVTEELPTRYIRTSYVTGPRII